MFCYRYSRYLFTPAALGFLVMFFFAAGVDLSAAGQPSDWEAQVRDSLLSLAAGTMYTTEPTIQEILDALGYEIDAENDAIDLDQFCLYPQSVWHLVAEYSGAAAMHEAGWYVSGAPGDTHTVLTAAMAPGDSGVLSGVSDDLRGLFHMRDAGTTWYTEVSWNYDARVHHKVYLLPSEDGYIVFWEDLGWMPDGDYNDMVFEIRPQNLPPTISVEYHRLCGLCPPYTICEGDTVCLEIRVNDIGCFGDTVTVEMISGEGDFTPVSGVGDFSVLHCWVPLWEGVRNFTFRATDNLGLSSEEVFASNVVFDHDPPNLSDPLSLEITVCLPEQICVDFSVTEDSYNELWTDPPGLYDDTAEEVCFDADTVGVYTIWIFAADSCGNVDSTLLTVTVNTTSPPVVTASPDNDFEICGPDSLCVVFSVYDADDDVTAIWTDDPGIINISDSTLCYVANDAGTIQLPIYVVDACGAADTAWVNFNITGGGAVTIECPEPIDTVLCVEGEICFPVSFSQSIDNITVTVLQPAYYNEQTGEVCFTPSTEDTYEITIMAEGDCGGDTCIVPVTVTFNQPPQTGFEPGNYDLFFCEPQTVCVPFYCDDMDGNLQSCTVIEAPAGYWLDGDQVCFTPVASGSYRIIIEATDECGLTDTDTIYVNIELNTAPTIVTQEELSIGLCDSDSVCIDIDIIDLEDNVVDIIVSANAAYNETEGHVCFYADADGLHTIRVIVVDDCGAADTVDIEITVTLNAKPEISCPPQLDTILCEPGILCFSLDLPEYSGGLDVTVEPIGSYDEINEEVCFNADTSGLYELSVIAVDTCGGADTCIARVSVTFNQPPVITGESGPEFIMCELTEVCIPVTCSDPDGNLASCDKISGPGTYDGSQICFTPTGEGTVNFEVLAIDECQESYQFQISATITLNEKPTITAPETVTKLICEPGLVCVDFSADDPEDGPLTISSSQGSIDPGAGTLCIWVDADFNECVEIYVYDTCGVGDTATVCFDIEINQKPDITVAEELSFDFCEPGQICFPVTGVDPAWVKSTTIEPFGEFNPGYTEVCLDVDTVGVYEITVIVTDSCDVADTASIRITVDLNEPPVLTLPGDMSMFRCAVGVEVCITGISAIDPGDNLASVVLTDGEGQYDDQTGELCFTPDTVGTYCFEITATDDCGAEDIGSFCVTIYVGEAPVIVLEPEIEVDIPVPGPICFPVSSTDADIDQLFDLEKISGAGIFATLEGRNSIVAEHCFDADTAGCYPFVFMSTDSCGLFDVESTVVCVTITPPDTSFLICVDTISALNGHTVDLAVIVYEAMEMGGFDLLICYDPSVLKLNHATQGPAIADWEYFTYRIHSPPIGCTLPCNADGVRLIGFADMNNGSPHPPEEAYIPIGVLAYLNFYITEDRNVIGQCIPIDFCTYDCGDNTISSRSGDSLFLQWNIEDILPDADCLVGDKGYTPIPVLEFCPGRICVIPPEDARGDINLNGIANEVGDAVLFINYFIYGNSVWDPIYYENQWLATDVNDDGLTRSIADLVYLIRIITGDADPYPESGEGGRPGTSYHTMILETRYENDEFVILSHCPVEIGGLFVRLSGDFDITTSPTFSEKVASLPPRYGISGAELRILYAGMELGVAIPAGTVELARFAANASKNIQITEAEAATYQGLPLNVQLAATAGNLPQHYELAQNYPNPFNANTVIQLSLPTASDYRLTIYDVTGRKVREYTGSAEAGIVRINWDGQAENSQPVASGIYFYRLTAGDFTASRKMILMK